ncbi:hypothetical protein [Microtetraspora malaysiensis]|uniref:hypothetical protein n=1 Tax=Microtetraspora malaysiensis TaxID=161358 RepID=UPI003D8BB576
MISRRCPKAHSASTTPVALHAPGGGLTSLPSSVGELTSLRRIDLDGNALTVLPAAVAAGDPDALRQPARLDPAGARITRLPDTIGRLGRLR